MNITCKEAHVLNPLICDEGTDATLYRMGYVLKHLQELYLAGKPDGIDNQKATGIFYIFGCIRGAIEFETEVSDVK